MVMVTLGVGSSYGAGETENTKTLEENCRTSFSANHSDWLNHNSDLSKGAVLARAKQPLRLEGDVQGP